MIDSPVGRKVDNQCARRGLAYFAAGEVDQTTLEPSGVIGTPWISKYWLAQGGPAWAQSLLSEDWTKIVKKAAFEQ